MMGEDPALKETMLAIQRAAATDATVLVLGESGTGKELMSRALHQLSARAKGPFVAINCAAIPEALLENELFGHEKGAFTGASGRKIGKAEMAHHGSLFLDEIGDLPLSLQGKILRLVQEKQFERVGGLQTLTVDVRVVAATNRDEGPWSAKFREISFPPVRVSGGIPPRRRRATSSRWPRPPRTCTEWGEGSALDAAKCARQHSGRQRPRAAELPGRAAIPLRRRRDPPRRLWPGAR